MKEAGFSAESFYSRIQQKLEASPSSASPSALALKSTNLGPDILSDEGVGDEETAEHLLENIVPGFNGTKTSSN